MWLTFFKAPNPKPPKSWHYGEPVLPPQPKRAEAIRTYHSHIIYAGVSDAYNGVQMGIQDAINVSVRHSRIGKIVLKG